MNALLIGFVSLLGLVSIWVFFTSSRVRPNQRRVITGFVILSLVILNGLALVIGAEFEDKFLQSPLLMALFALGAILILLAARSSKFRDNQAEYLGWALILGLAIGQVLAVVLRPESLLIRWLLAGLGMLVVYIQQHIEGH